MDITFWGSRGSSPRVTSHDDMLTLLRRLVTDAQQKNIHTLPDFLVAAETGRLGSPIVYGGHTPCTEVSHGARRFFVDMGSGWREAGTKYMAKEKSYTVFLTHMHWDHLLGINFFIPIFVPGNKITIYHVHKNAPEFVKLMFNGVNFPVKWEALGATVEFVQVKLYDQLQFDDVTVSPFALDHPGGSFGWRFDAGGKSLAVGFDGEYKRVSRAELGNDLAYYQNLDFLVFDAQYDLAEVINRYDWGHSSPTIGIDLALREGIKTIALVHHDPWASDDKLRSALAQTRAYSRARVKNYPEHWSAQPDGPTIIMAYDGLTLDMNRPVERQLTKGAA